MSASRNPFSSAFLRGDADDRLRPQGKLSYVAGPTDDALKFMTIPQLLDRACARHGAGDAAIFAAQNQAMTWYDRGGKALSSLGEPSTYFDVQLSNDDKQLAVTDGNTSAASIWIYDLASKRKSRLTFSPGADESLVTQSGAAGRQALIPGRALITI